MSEDIIIGCKATKLTNQTAVMAQHFNVKNGHKFAVNTPSTDLNKQKVCSLTCAATTDQVTLKLQLPKGLICHIVVI